MSKTHMSRNEVASLLEDFLAGKGGEWDWDDFITATELHDEQLEAIRLRCAKLDSEFPPTKRGKYTNENGLEVIREYIRKLRADT